MPSALAGALHEWPAERPVALRKIKDLAEHPTKIGAVAAPGRGCANAAGPGAELQLSGQREGS
jgi:hypothetical protein